jgi:hypothetical protein
LIRGNETATHKQKAYELPRLWQYQNHGGAASAADHQQAISYLAFDNPT